MKKNLTLSLIVVLTLSSTFLIGCKFTFEESEYLGAYQGEFESDVPTYTSGPGVMYITDAGDQMINIQISSGSNPLIYFSNVQVVRGYSLVSDNLRVNHDDIDMWINRNTHRATLRYYGTGSYSDYSFTGNRQ